MQQPKNEDNLRRFGFKHWMQTTLALALLSLIPAKCHAQTPMVGFGMGQNFSTQDWYYRGTLSLFANESMWGFYQAFEFRPATTTMDMHFKLPTGIYARLRGPLYLHYGMDAGTALAFQEPLRHDLGLSLRFDEFQLITNYAGRNGWSAQIAVPIK